MAKEDIYEELGTLASGFSTYCEEPFKNIFKKSEHDEIMDELVKIKKKLDDFPDCVPLVPYPFPCPHPYEKCTPCPWIPYSYDYDYPYPYYRYGDLQWTYTCGVTS